MPLLETLLVLETRRRDAWFARDKETLASLLDEEFYEINYFGRLSKYQLLNDLFERLLLQEFTLEDAMVHGTEASPILTYACFERLTIDGAEVAGRFRVASHFVQRAAAWKILLWQITPVRDS